MEQLEKTARLLQRHRRVFALVLYACFTFLAYGTAYLLRFEFAVPAGYRSVFLLTFLPLIGIRLTVFRALRLSRERWRYAGTRDVVRLILGCVIGSTAFALIFRVLLGQPVPLSVVAIESILTCGITAGVWLSYRLAIERAGRNGGNGKLRRVIIIGAGDAGNMLAREMLRGPSTYRPVAFIDDNPAMWGATVQGLEVTARVRDLPAVATHCRADELIIAVPSASPAALREIVRHCESTGLPFKVLPAIEAVIAGDVSVNQLREVQIEDLLGREPIILELPELTDDLRNRTVLITGAAGSIGSELARQVALHGPSRLLLLDQAETALFFLDLELRSAYPDVEIVPIICDIVEAAGIDRVFRIYEPERVFHAAAYKHVPLMESNPREAVRNNVIGTWRVAETAGRYRAERFVLVSTDKAVRPSSVMGATKRLAELTVLDLQKRFPDTAFGAVRFGNVLGSNGSVIPIFKQQLREGRPLTVTHPEMTRYFMTIPEAVQLILQASLLREFRGHIAMLDMGEPVLITDLAKNLLRLSGLPINGDSVVFTGLRPGEKMHEELSAPDEEPQPTVVPKVCILKSPHFASLTVARKAESWEAALSKDPEADVISGLFEIFPQLTAAKDLDVAGPLSELSIVARASVA